jgi:hypothetical protein
MTEQEATLAKSMFSNLSQESKAAYTKRLVELSTRATEAVEAFATWSEHMDRSNARESVGFTLVMHATSMRFARVLESDVPDHIKILRTVDVCADFARACAHALPAITQKYAPEASCEWMKFCIAVSDEMMAMNEELKQLTLTQN